MSALELNSAEVDHLAEPIRNWTGAPGSPERTWAEKGGEADQSFYVIHEQN
jgi:hypothetical protein